MASPHKRNLKDLIEIGGGISILVGIIFVGLELRQNTAAVQAATNQDLIHASSEFLINIGSDPETYRVYSTGRLDPSELTPGERGQYYLLQQAFWLRMQNAFMQWQRGTLIHEDWIVYQSVICGSATTPGPEAHWRGENALTPAFKEFLETCGE